MYLERIIGTRTKVAALDVLLNNQGQRFLESALASKANMTVSEVNRQMPSLVQTGLVKMERVGKGKLYQINERHFLAPALKRLFMDLNAAYRKAADEICKFTVSSMPGAVAVILAGSAARQQVRQDLVGAPSDIDMVFIVKSEKEKGRLFNELISYVNGEVAAKYGISCYPVVLTQEEYLAGLKKQERFVVSIQAEGVELYGKKPRRFAAASQGSS